MQYERRAMCSSEAWIYRLLKLWLIKVCEIYYVVEGANMDFKTNMMRLLDQKKIKYMHYTYVDTDAISGVEVAAILGENPNQVFKTLVTTGKSKRNYVFMIPVNQELDLKKAAASVGEKSIEMLKSKELLPLTGYVHGGCSPIGMKKNLLTVIDVSAERFSTIICSAGKIGYQVELTIADIQKLISLQINDVVVSHHE